MHEQQAIVVFIVPSGNKQNSYASFLRRKQQVKRCSGDIEKEVAAFSSMKKTHHDSSELIVEMK
jgi:hypothetical protein